MAPSLDRQGYWGQPTSTLDWCEENYVVSFYIAEFCKYDVSLALILKNINVGACWRMLRGGEAVSRTVASLNNVNMK